MLPETWRVERLVPGGEGFLHLPDGRAAFVPAGLPGDTVSVATVEDRGGFVRAVDVRLVAPSPDRVGPPCAHAARCGGCDWMALARPAQLEAKRGLVVEALRRTGGFADASVDPVVTAGADLGYRSRVRYHVSEGRIGYYRPGSHVLVEVERCAVADERLGRVLDAFRSDEELTASLDAVSARVDSEGRVVVWVTAPDSRRLEPRRARALRELGRRFGFDVALDGEEDSAVQRMALDDGRWLLASGDVFTQVNWEVNRAIVRDVMRGAREWSVETFVDVFAGVGNFTLPLLACGLEGTAIEANGRAVDLARRAAAEAGLSRGTFVEGDAISELRRMADDGRRFDLVVVDPPRTGARDMMPLLARMAVGTVAYVSCDPVTFARDASRLCAEGYRLLSVTPYDMFPHTHHVEVLGWLRREPSTSHSIR